jgi:hypothetical protein
VQRIERSLNPQTRLAAKKRLFPEGTGGKRLTLQNTGVIGLVYPDQRKHHYPQLQQNPLLHNEIQGVEIVFSPDKVAAGILPIT